MDSATERLLEYAGKRRNQVSNPCLTANQAIAVANDIQSLQRERDAMLEYLKSRSQTLFGGINRSHYENFLHLNPEFAKGASQ